MPQSGSALSTSSKSSFDSRYQNECWYRMARSKRRCATSLQDVSKWTVPNRWSVSSCARTGGEKETLAAIEAAATASADLIMGLLLSVSDVRATGRPFFNATKCSPAPQFRRAGDANSKHNRDDDTCSHQCILFQVTRLTRRKICRDLKSWWLDASASCGSRSARRPANAPAFRRNARSKLAASVIPIPADGFMEGIWERSPAAPKWPFTTAFRASCLSASDRNPAIRRVL